MLRRILLVCVPAILAVCVLAEFVGDDVDLAIKAAYELGLKPKPDRVTYRISFEATPLRDCDYMLWNRLFELFEATRHRPHDETIQSRIAVVATVTTRSRADVPLEEKGWRQVDPTGGGVIACGIYHIAYLTSEDGRLPIAYLSWPQIELFDGPLPHVPGNSRRE